MPRAYLKWPASPQLSRSCLLVLHMRFRMWMSRMWMGLTPFHRTEHLLEGDVVLVEAVGDEQPGDPVRHIPGPPQQGGGVVLFLGGRSVPCRYEPGVKIHDGRHIPLLAADLLMLLITSPLVPNARGLEGLRVYREAKVRRQIARAMPRRTPDTAALARVYGVWPGVNAQARPYCSVRPGMM